jgi:hypothetical protein
VATAAALLTLGCAQGPAEPIVSPLPVPVAEVVILYFPHVTRPELVREERSVTRSGEQPEMLVLRELLRGPVRPDARPALPLPEGTVDPPWLWVAGVKVFDGNLDLYLNAAGGAALARAGRLGVYAVVNSLGTIERVERVRFLIDGSDRPFFVDGLEITRLLAPAWSLVRE